MADIDIHRKDETPLADRIAELINEARQRTVAAVNTAMVYTYYEIGRMIVEEEQRGEKRADYGTAMLKNVAKKLTIKFGKGFSYSNLRQIRQFYLIYSEFDKHCLSNSNAACQIQKSATLSRKTSDEKAQTLSEELQVFDNKVYPRFTLSWSHYLKLMRIENADERRFYEIEATNNHWSLRELERQYDSSLYERLALSRDKQGILELSRKGQIVEKPQDLIKDPYILEFTGLPELPEYSEKKLETKLIDHLQTFMLELGKGFTFAGRQVRITFEEEHYFIDLVFYNRLLRAFVLVDLKRGKLKHQDIGQMQMYVNYYDREVKLEDENPTIGILLCADKSDAVVQYTLPADNNQIFASKYKTVLPTKEELRRLLMNK